jgi:hypothetical protein
MSLLYRLGLFNKACMWMWQEAAEYSLRRHEGAAGGKRNAQLRKNSLMAARGRHELFVFHEFKTILQLM